MLKAVVCSLLTGVCCLSGTAEPCGISVFLEDVVSYSRQANVSVAEAAGRFVSAGISGLDYGYDEKLDVGSAVSAGMQIVNVYGVVDFLSPDRGAKTTEAFLARAAELKSPRVMLIPGYFTPGGDREKEMSAILEGMRGFVAKAQEKGLDVLVEDFGNPASPCSQIKYVRRMLNECPGVGFALDSGNFAYAGHGDDILVALSEFEDKIRHVHLKDHPQGRDRQYVSLGTGTVPNAEILRTLARNDYTGWITLENFVGDDYLADAKRQVEFVKTRLRTVDYEPLGLKDVKSRAANTLKYGYLPNRFFEKVRDGKMALGGYVSMTDPQVCWAAGVSGLDFIWIDMEHNAMTVKDLSNMQIALDGLGCASFVRVRSSEFNHLKPILDVGIDGVIVPQVESYEEAVRVVEACRYPQAGGKRGICVGRQAGFGRIGIWDFLRRSETWPMIVIELEDDKGVRDLDRILKLKDVDAIMIGPSDWSCSRSGLKEASSEEMKKRLDDIAARVNAAGKLFFALGDFKDAIRRRAGIFCGDGDIDRLVGGWRNMMQNLEAQLQ